MNRVLLIDEDRTLASAMSRACLESGTAIRMAESLCEGVRYLLEAPVSVILVDAELLRLPGTTRARLFDTAAPGVPVVVMLEPGAPVEEQVKLELEGFRVVSKPIDPRDLLAKVERASKQVPARPGAHAEIGALCR